MPTLEWNVKNAINRDVERQHLNKILADIRASVTSLEQKTTTTSSVTPGTASSIKDVVGEMVSNNSEVGISVTYNLTDKVLDFALPNFIITLAGDVTGSATVAGLGNVTITTSIDPAMAGISDAPVDFNYYWRHTGGWEQVQANIIALADVTTSGLTSIDLTNPEAPVWNPRTIVEGAGIDVVNGSGVGGNPTISHEDTSTVANLTSDNSNRVILQDYSITFDTFGHVQTVSVGTLDLDTVYGAALATGGTTGQFWRGDKSWSNTLLGQMVVSHTGTPAFVVFRNNLNANSVQEFRGTDASVYLGKRSAGQMFAVGTDANLSAGGNVLCEAAPGAHSWRTGTPGSLTVKMDLGLDGRLSITGGSDSGLTVIRNGTAEPFMLLQTQTANSGGQFRGLDAGGMRFTDNNATNEWLRLATTGTVFNEGGLNIPFRVEGDSLTHLLFVDATATAENIALATGSAPNWQSMDRGIFLGNAETPPSGNPVSGVFIYGDAGAAKVRGASGTTTTFGPAEPHCPVCGSDFTTEHQNDEKYGYLSICLKCLADYIGDKPWIVRRGPN